MSYMTNVTLEEVQHLATLSSLQLSDDEATSLSRDISNILDYINQLDELDTEGVEPTYQVTDLSNVWRDDVAVDSSVSREELLSLSKDQLDNQVKVPKVL
ncbi:MAG: Asp-tRNA(Asn)/Glu-tRNA(Gln) amidotransferase subunit GatC [bacterium]|nr:Asp-tRNA(Asn)/Glu-tRNA(Gln) amidotransferase subunit GatC [bacterium]MDN5835023.1 Asp-tRNA(Asn)/Glu-tRNA(Gln) amidotransferase subunit GatC [bacterium]